MLADVMKQREIERQQEIDKDMELYNHPYKRDTIIYFSNIHVIGGIETWIYNLGKKYEFSVVYNKANKKQLERLADIGIETIKYVGQDIECDTLIFNIFDVPPIKSKKRYVFMHGLYDELGDIPEIPKCDELYAVSRTAAEHFEVWSGIKPKVMYNPLEIEIKQEPLILGIFSRLSSEKGKNRIIYLLDKLREHNKPFLMLIFTDLPFDYDDSRVVFIPPTLDNKGWMKKCDYIVQLSDTESACFTMWEALKMGIPLITTNLEMLKEFNIDNSNAKILEFDMSNLDIDDLWNKPVVKNWKEPVSKEWEDIMKKKVLRERQVIDQLAEEKPKTEVKKKVKK